MQKNVYTYLHYIYIHRICKYLHIHTSMKICIYIYMYIHTNLHDTGTLLDSGPGRKTHGSQQTQGSGRGGLGLGLVSERAVAIFFF